MIEVKNASFAYGRTVILKGMDLNFERGKLYAIIGPNGSGKTTLIKLLSNQAKPGSGELILDGKAYAALGRKEFARQVALLPQGRNTPNTTVFDLVSCGRYPYLDISRKLSEQDLELVRSALAATGTEDFAQRNVKKLSGGERQRVYMAMLYAQDTPYVLLDEPTTHLDIASGFQMMQQLLQMKSQGKCVIAVLHDLAMALKYADEILLVNKGEVLISASAENIIKSGSIPSAFGVNCVSVELDGKPEYIFEAI